MSKIFISHASANNFEAIAIQEWLLNQGWDELFLDLDPKQGIAAGERWERTLHDAANRCDAILFCVTKEWLESEWCRKEYRLARRLNKQLFGLLMEELDISSLPDELTSTWQLVELASGTDHQIHRIIHPYSNEEKHIHFSKQGLIRLHTGLVKAGLDPKFFEWPPESDPGRPPYRGLRPLDVCDAGIFFGREAPTIELLSRLRGLKELPPPRFMVILGASGAGKSSFLRAGIMPRLARDERHFVPLPVLRPEKAAITGETGLTYVLLNAFADSKVKTNRAALRDMLLNTLDSETHRDKLASLLHAYFEEKAQRTTLFDSSQKPVLVLGIDQAEELFMGEGEAESTILLELLKHLTQQDNTPILVLFTIRSDSYETLQAYKSFENVSQQTFSLSPMPTGAYQEVIEGPARRLTEHGNTLEIEPALTEKLLKDLDSGSGKDSLPLLAFTLERLHKDYGDDGDLTLEEYDLLGGINGAINAATEEVFQRAISDPRLPAERESLEALMRRAIVPWLAGIDPETQAPRRRIARMTEIPAEAHPLVELLIEQRLLSTDINAEKEITVEPAHEALLRQWGLLKGWLKEDFAALMILESLQRATRDWLANDKSVDWLNHSAGRLEDAEALIAREDMSGFLSPSDATYVQTCRKLEDEIKNKALNEAKKLAEAKQKEVMAQKRVADLTRKGLIVASFLLVIALFASWQAFTKKEEAELSKKETQQALAVSLAAQADIFDSRGEKDKALLFYQESLRRNYSNTVETKTWQLFNKMPIALAQASTGIDPTWASISIPSRNLALVGNKLGGYYAIEKKNDNYTFNHYPAGNAAMSAMAIAEDESTIFAGDTRGDIWRIDINEENQISSNRVHSDSNSSQIRAIALHPDGETLALGFYSGEVSLYSITDNSKTSVYKNPTGLGVYALHFSRTDDQLFVAGANYQLVVLSGENYASTETVYSSRNSGRQFSPTKNDVYFLSQNELIYWETDTGKAKQSYIVEDDQHMSMLADTGDSLILGDYDGGIQRVDKDSFSLKAEAKLTTGWVQSILPFDQTTLVINRTGEIIEIDSDSLSVKQRTLGRTLNNIVMASGDSALYLGSSDKLHRYDFDSLTPNLTSDLHPGVINAIAVSPTGKFLATASTDESVRVLDESNFDLVAQFDGFNSSVSSVTFLSDKLLVVGLSNGVISLLDIATGTYLYKAHLHQSAVQHIVGVIDPEHPFSVTPQGELIISTNNNGRVVFSDVYSGMMVRSLQIIGANYAIKDVGFSADKKEIALSLADGKVCIWEHAFTDEYLYGSHTFEQEDLNCLSLHSDSVNSLVHAGDRWIAGTADGLLIEFDANGVQRTFPVHQGSITQLHWNNPTQMLVTVSADTRIKNWHLPVRQTRTLPEALEDLTGNLYQTMVMDNQLFIAGGKDIQRVLSISLDDSEYQWVSDYYQASSVSGNQFYSLASNEKYIAMGGQNGYLALQDRVSGETSLMPITSSFIQHLQFSDSSSGLLAGYNDGRIEIFDTDNPTATPTHFYQHGSAVTSLIKFPGDSRVISSDIDGKLMIWDEASGDVQFTMQSRLGIGSVALGAQGDLIAVGEKDGTLSLYKGGDVQKSSLIWQVKSIEDIHGLVFSEASDILVAYSRRQVAFIDTRNGTQYFSSEKSTSKYYNSASIYGAQLLLTGHKGLYELFDLAPITNTEGVDLLNAITETIGIKMGPNQSIQPIPHEITLQPVEQSNE